MGRDKLLNLFHKTGTKIFYETKRDDEGEIIESRFIPARLSAFLRIVWHVKTIEPTNPRFAGDVYRYDFQRDVYRGNATVRFDVFTKNYWGEDYVSIPRSRVYADLMASTYIERSQFESAPEYIAVGGCMIHLKKEDGKWIIETLPNSPEYLVLSRLPVKYDSKASNDSWLKFLYQLLPDNPDAIKRLQEFTGYMLYRRWVTDWVLVLLGEGNNGKTTLISVLQELLGHENTVSRSLQDLCNGTWYIADIWQKLANIHDDLSDLGLKTTGTFKQLTGGTHLMKGERKYGDPFDFSPTCKHLFVANRLPSTPDDTEAFMRRWDPIVFNQTFTPSTIRDETLVDKLTTPEMLSGILNWALEGLIRLMNNDWKPTNRPSSEEVRALWRSRTGNAVIPYIYNSGEVEVDPKGLYLASEFIADVNKYAIANKLSFLTGKMVGVTIRDDFYGMIGYRKINHSGRKGVLAYTGIRKKGHRLTAEDDVDHDLEERED
jgi:P4 family phage/plasmid primase-like protien